MVADIGARTTAPTLAQKGPVEWTGTSLLSSAQAVPIPIVWGTRRVAPTIIWQAVNPFVLPGGSPLGTLLNDAYVATAPDSGGDGVLPVYAGGVSSGAAVRIIPGGWIGGVYIGGGTAFPNRHYGQDDPGNSDSQWWVPANFGLCEGPVNAITRIWNGGGTSSISTGSWTSGVIPTGSATWNTTVNPPSLFYNLFTGSGSQTAWDYVATVNAYPGGPYYDAALTYRFLAYIASALVAYGHGNKPPQQAFEVVRTPDTSARLLDSRGLGYDYAPDLIVVDLLTSVQYGAGLSASDIDSASLTAYEQYVRALGVYLSPKLDSQTAVTDIIDRWALLTNAWIFWDGSVLRFVPLGDESLTGNGQTYTPDTTPAYDLSNANFLGPLQVDRADPIDCNNRVRLEIADRGADYAKNPIEWKDSTLINQFGLRDASDVNADDICDPAVGAIVVDLVGKRMAYLRVTYTFTLTDNFIRLLPGSIVTITDPNLGLDHVLARVLKIEEDAGGNLAIVAEEYSGTLGIARPLPVQRWLQQGGASGGSSTGSGSSTTGGPGTSSGGTGTVPDPGTLPVVVWFLTVAGDTWTMPASPVLGRTYEFTHDLQRVPQPTLPLLENNPVTFVRPGGATYQFEDPQDRAAPYAISATWRISGGTIGWRFDGSNFRCVN